MFNKKYTVTILDSKWNILKDGVKMLAIPRQDELMYFDTKYYEVINVIHMIDDKHKVIAVVDESRKTVRTENL